MPKPKSKFDVQAVWSKTAMRWSHRPDKVYTPIQIAEQLESIAAEIRKYETSQVAEAPDTAPPALIL